MSPESLTTADADDVVDVLADAFAGYPVMRHVLDGRADPGDPGLRRLVHFFAMARLLSGHPALGIRDGGGLAAVALVTPPSPGRPPATLARLKDAVWAELGEGARARYEAFGRACAGFLPETPHHHLNMIGVRGARQGEGLARRLLDAVHERVAADPASTGVSLTTEAPANLPFYERFGYRRIGHARVSPRLETWGFFRPG